MGFEFLDMRLENKNIQLICTAKTEPVPEKGYFPAYKFDIALSDGTTIGKCDLRVGHNENTYFGGNIGYSIDEPYRGHRYASQACELLFKLAARHDMDYVIITCSVDNRASDRTCQVSGGMLIDTADVPKGSELYKEGVHRVNIYKFLLKDMRVLKTLDAHDYNIHGKIYNRHSVRGIIIRDGKVAMAHVTRYGYYKFPGGGSDGIETKVQTLIREVREESGLIVKPETIRPYGIVKRKELNHRGNMFCQDNFYYLCEAEDEIQEQELSEGEERDGYVLEFIDPRTAIRESEKANLFGNARTTIKRETLVLQSLIDEGYFN